MAQYFISLFFGVSTLLFADIFHVSYRAQVKDAHLLHDSLYASKTMTEVVKSPYKTKTIFLTQKCEVVNFFNCYEDEILAFIYADYAQIKSIDRTQKLQVESFLELDIPPLYLKVDFNDTFATISLLK